MVVHKRIIQTRVLLLILILPFTLAMIDTPKETLLVNNACQSCHSLKKVCAKLGKSEQVWQKTLDRMQAKGSGLNDAQNQMLASFLSETDAASSGFCK